MRVARPSQASLDRPAAGNSAAGMAPAMASQTAASLARAPARPPSRRPAASATALRAPALAPLAASKAMSSRSSSASSTPQVKAPCAPPPCSPRFRGLQRRRSAPNTSRVRGRGRTVGGVTGATRRRSSLSAKCALPYAGSIGDAASHKVSLARTERLSSAYFCTAHGIGRTGKDGRAGRPGGEPPARLLSSAWCRTYVTGHGRRAEDIFFSKYGE